MEAHVVWGDGEPFKSDILDHYVRIAHSPPFFSFREEGIINFLPPALLNLIFKKIFGIIYIESEGKIRCLMILMFDDFEE